MLGKISKDFHVKKILRLFHIKKYKINIYIIIHLKYLQGYLYFYVLYLL